MTLEALRNQLPEADRNNIDLENNKYIIYSANITNNANGDKTGTLTNIAKLGVIDTVDYNNISKNTCDVHNLIESSHGYCCSICFVKTIEYVLDKSYIISADNAELEPIFNYGPAPNENGEIDLSNYASKYVADYRTCETLPEENEKYLAEVLTSGKFKVINMNSMFKDCASLLGLTNISKIGGWDTSNVTDMSKMFYNCKSLTYLDISISNWDTSKVTDMNSMFEYCKSLTSLDVSNWDTSKVEDMSYIFNNCSSITSIDVSKWDTSKVTNMHDMFYNCYKLTSIGDVSNWDTSNVTRMYDMFGDCESLTSLNASNWDTSNVTNMTGMFDSCSKLTTITGTIDLTSCTNYSFMLYSTSALTSINIKLPSTITQSDFFSESQVTNKSAVHFVS